MDRRAKSVEVSAIGIMIITGYYFIICALSIMTFNGVCTVHNNKEVDHNC